ncbi:MAG TPA: cobalt ECF transporter T component CbiQ [Acidobacteriota bacterium]|nr:cobalt ECF transporter T component CbiQ [Acidobacteriota bacterium]
MNTNSATNDSRGQGSHPSRDFLERSLSRLTGILEESVFAEESASQAGWLQQMDPRVKTSGFVLILLSAAFSHSIIILVLLILFSVLLAAGSRIFSLSFLRRVWILMPFYTALVAFPALFSVKGDPFFTIPGLGLTVTRQGLTAATFITLRVATSVSFMLLLVLTTPWPKLLKALRSFGAPRFLIFLLNVTYRYIYVLLHTANSFFLARKSRRVGSEAWLSNSRWIGTIAANLMAKSYYLSSEVYLAMQSRGFRGEPLILTDFKLKHSDILWMVLLYSVAGLSFYFGFWNMK